MRALCGRGDPGRHFRWQRYDTIRYSRSRARTHSPRRMTKRRGPGSSPVTMTPTRTPVATAPALRAHTGGERCYATMKDRRRLAQTCAFIVRTRRPTAATGANSWARGLARVGACDSDSARASKQEPPGHGCIQHACLFAAAQKRSPALAPGPYEVVCRSAGLAWQLCAMRLVGRRDRPVELHVQLASPCGLQLRARHMIRLISHRAR